MKKIIYTCFVSLLFVECNSQPSLQKYMVENSENSNFIAVDLGTSILDVDDNELSKEEKKSLKKLNILFFRKKEDNQELYLQEKEKVQIIISKNSQYEQLVKLGTKGNKINVYSVGTGNFIEEALLLVSNEEAGFMIVRLLGKKMNSEYVMSFVSIFQKANINSELDRFFDSLQKN